jgi:transposase
LVFVCYTVLQKESLMMSEWQTMAISRLTDDEWLRIGDFIPVQTPSAKGGRPCADNRSCLEGILWIMSTGAQWSELPKTYPGYATCWRRLKKWATLGILTNMRHELLAILNARGRISWDEAFVDATFAPGKKGVKK